MPIPVPQQNGLGITRPSNQSSLVDYYNRREKAGGAGDAYRATTNNMIPPGDVSITSTTFTKEPGFTVAGAYPNKPWDGQSNFTEGATGALNISSNGFLRIAGRVFSNQTIVNSTSTTWDGFSFNEGLFHTKVGFQQYTRPGDTEFKDAAGSNVGNLQSLQLSRFMSNFNNQKYGTSVGVLNSFIQSARFERFAAVV